MTRISWFVAFTIIALAGLRAEAQESPSHTHIGEWDGGNNTRKALQMAQMLRERAGADVPQQQIEPELIKKILDALQNQGEPGLRQALENNPELRRAFSRLDQDNPELRRQLENRTGIRIGANGLNPDQMKDLIERFKSRNTSRLGGAEPPIVPNVPERPSATSPPPNIRTPSGQRPSANGERNGEQASRSDSSPDRARSERFAEFMKRMKNWFPQSLKDSPNFKRFVDRLGATDWSKRASKLRLWPEGKGPQINWDRGLHRSGRFFDRMLSGIDGRRMPSLPSAPNLPNAPNLPSVGVPSASGSFEVGSGFTTVMVLAALALGAFLYWRLIVKPASARARKPGAWSAGPWPVDPARVRTREEVIRAFDYLALLSGGKPAQTWHHREIANRLGSENDTRRATALRLAQVYENARYAPPIEPLADAQIDFARQDICSLAGVGAS